MIESAAVAEALDQDTARRLAEIMLSGILVGLRKDEVGFGAQLTFRPRRQPGGSTSQQMTAVRCGTLPITIVVRVDLLQPETIQRAIRLTHRQFVTRQPGSV